MIEKLEQSNEIMLVIFEEFLSNNTRLLLSPPDDDSGIALKELIKACEQKLPPKFTKEQIRWHIAVFFSEFVINHSITDLVFVNLKAELNLRGGRFTDFFSRFDCLNWAGKRLYKELKGGTD